VDTGTATELLPRQFGKYTLLSRLPAGGMAELFLALQRSMSGFEKLVVIKRILPAKSKDGAFVEMFLREARIAATMSHPNVVQTFDAGELEGNYFIAMEHLDGEDLRTTLSAVKNSGAAAPLLEYALYIALGVCSGLTYIHEKRDLSGAELGVVHCDISTRNVVVGYSGDVKIVDFGIATTSDLDDSSESAPRQIKGKARYMSPEQTAGEAPDGRADIFSLGVVLFELTTGHRLFPGGSNLEMLKSVRDSDYTRPRELVAGYPPRLERIVMRALRRDRAERYQSAREMLAELEEFVIRHDGLAVSSIGVATWMRSLFQTKLASQAETLRGQRRLALGLAAEHDPGVTDSPAGDRSLPRGAAGGSVGPHEVSVPPPPRWRVGTPALVAVNALSVVAAFLYLQHTTSDRFKEALAKYRESQPVLPAATAVSGSLEIATKPEGCAIWVNGDLRPELTPAKLGSIPLERELHIKLTKDGFEPYRSIERLTADAPFKDVNAQMQRLSATILLQSDGHVAFNLFVDGKLWKDHSKIEGLSADEEHLLGVFSHGFAPKTLRVTLQPGETRAIDVRLTRAQADAEDQPASAQRP
jgi:eukaryotic-like serine/threonine-protein kinase